MEHGEKCFVKTHSYYENGGWVVWVSPYRRGCKISLLSTRHRRWALSKWFIPSWFQVVMLQKQRIGGEQKRKIFLEYLALMAFGNKYCSLVERCWTDWLKIWYHVIFAMRKMVTPGTEKTNFIVTGDEVSETYIAVFTWKFFQQRCSALGFQPGNHEIHSMAMSLSMTDVPLSMILFCRQKRIAATGMS